MTAALNVAARIKELLESLQLPALAPYLSDWPRNYVRRATVGSNLTVLRWLPQMAGDTAAFGLALVAAVAHAAASLAWRQTYTAMDAAFLENYGWSEILGGSGAFVSERIACGFLILGPHTLYPLHYHQAEEIYVPLSGTAAWQQGDAVWRARPPGTPVRHASDEPHAMRTGASPLLALYLWRGANLGQRARLAGA